MVDRILHNLSLLMNQSFKTVQELNRFRKELGKDISKELADAIAIETKPQVA